LSFPESRHSDQIDSVSQALAYEKFGYSLEYVQNLSKFVEALQRAQMWGFR
jgi:hypothetical protein